MSDRDHLWMRRLFLVLTITVLGLVCLPMAEPARSTPPVDSSTPRRRTFTIAHCDECGGHDGRRHRDLAALSTRLLIHLGSDKANLALSPPLSFHSVLVLLAAGATGATLDQIVSFLGPSTGGTAHASLASHVASGILTGETGAEPDVRIAVGVWVDSSFRLRPAFADKAASQYKAAGRPMPFQEKTEEARVEINRWFEDKTGGLIKDLMPNDHLSSDTILVIGNALSLRGTWLDPFDRDDTVDGDFFLPDESSPVRVPFMTSTNSQRISSHPGFKVLQLPYECSGNHRFSMHIYLPDDRDGLQALVRELSSDTAGLLDRCVPQQAVMVGDFRIPKFKASFKIEASDLLKNLGLERPFHFSYDFAEMVDCSEPLTVGSVLHQCVVEVDEDGTMAAASTEADVIMGCSIEGEEPEAVDFVADHPFLFLVTEDRSGILLFAGQVVNPLL
ncbi:serpin-Z1-like [Lolium perenne]|uniref:serpin-Z1-like n=1 Tax=Lolium perenne TaxID=4522 RepID=UPI003A9969D8